MDAGDAGTAMVSSSLRVLPTPNGTAVALASMIMVGDAAGHS